MNKWPGAYRADKRRKELERVKHREDKEKRLAERRAAQRAYDIEHGIIPPDPVEPAADAAAPDAAPAPGTPPAAGEAKKDGDKPA